MAEFPPNANGQAALDLVAKLKAIPGAGVNPITQAMQDAKGDVLCDDGTWKPYFWVNPVDDTSELYEWTSADGGQFKGAKSQIQVLAFQILLAGNDDFSADVHPATQEQADKPFNQLPLTSVPKHYTAAAVQEGPPASLPEPVAPVVTPTPNVSRETSAPTPAVSEPVPLPQQVATVIQQAKDTATAAGHVAGHSAVPQLLIDIENMFASVFKHLGL